MDPFHILILFLILTGGLAMAAVLLKWKWPWRGFQGRLFISIFGAERARLVTAGLGFVMLVTGIILPFVHDSGEPFDPDFTLELARPGGVNLAASGALELLQEQLEQGHLLELERNGTDGFWFSYRIDPSDPRFGEVRRMLDAWYFPHGFNINAKTYRGGTVKGGKVYLDANLEFCSNALGTDRPLKSAQVLLVVLNQEGSWVEDPNEGAVVLVATRGSEPFNAFAIRTAL